MPEFNDIIDDYADSKSFSLITDLNTVDQNSEGGILFILQEQYCPDVEIQLSIERLDEIANKTLYTFLVDNRAKTFKVDLTRYRLDYNGTDPILQQMLSGIVNMRLNDRRFESRSHSNAVHLQQSPIKLIITRNEIL
jgi:hypothetical protein